MKSVLIHIFILCSFTLFSQNKIIEAYIIDAGKNQPVVDALIYSWPSGLSCSSNAHGKFSIQVYSQINSEEDDISIIGNSICWNSNIYNYAEIFDLKSSLVYRENIRNNNSLTIKGLSSGYYFLNLTGDHVRKKYMIFTTGEKISAIQKSKLNSPMYSSDTILKIRKHNYFELEYSINKISYQDSIYLLKKVYDSLTHFTHLVSHDAYEMLSTTPSVTNYGDVKEIKAIHDLRTDKIYYINIKEERSHYAFAKRHLDYELSPYDFLYSQYSNNAARYLNLVTILYHRNLDKYILQFSSIDQIDCDGILDTYNRILQTSYFGDKLFFYSNNLKWDACPDIPHITSEELFYGQQYQALNEQENYGYLIKKEYDQIQNSYLGRNNIIILNGIPNDIPVVAGIITTEFQTPLSHINILSHNRNTPNMALKGAWSNTLLNSLIGQLVYFKVASDTFEIRKAGLEEAEAFWAEHSPQDTIVLQLDTVSNGLIELDIESIHSTKKIGGKAANFSELVHLDSIPIPEDYFAIPFFYYYQHLKDNEIDLFIDQMLSEGKFYSDQNYRKMRLIQLQNIIKNTPLNPNLIELVENRIDHFSRFSSYRFRSSTNAEDLEDFSGAGLYSSYSAKKNNPNKTIEKAIKKVWASLWHIRAFEERDYFKIDHRSVAMGILVHRSFPDEDANGVAITSNLYNVNHAYTINCQYKDISIVYPEPGVLHDQILIHTKSFDGNPYTIEYLTHSNIQEPDCETVLTNDELFQLGDFCTMIKDYYFNHIAQDVSIGYVSFSVDIEFKIDSSVSPRKLYIKQARIYKAYQ